MKILVTGGSGQVGSLLQQKLVSADFEVKSCDSQELDITDLSQVLAMESWQPKMIINAAAYTAVDQAESEPEKAFSVNARGVENLLALAKKCDCPIINISTDYVFDGNADTPYKEGDDPKPLNVYGRSKLEGEKALIESGHPFINIRTSWVFGENGKNFVKTMLRLGAERDSLSLVADQVGCPTYAGDIAELITLIVIRFQEKTEFFGGNYHFCGDKAVSWFEFAGKIFDLSCELGLLEKSPDLRPITTLEYPAPAPRPYYSVLDCSKLKGAYGVDKSDWSESLNVMLSEHFLH